MEKGVVIWFTGVPAAGKSTIATAVQQRLEALDLPVENLDADEVRKNLSPNLGYDEAARDENTKRLAWVAMKMSAYGANVMIAAVAPRQAYRDRAREWCEKFVEVFVDAPLEVCQQRDPKGLYARGPRRVNDIAGMHQPYEAPVNRAAHQDRRVHRGRGADMVMAKLVGWAICRPRSRVRRRSGDAASAARAREKSPTCAGHRPRRRAVFSANAADRCGELPVLAASPRRAAARGAVYPAPSPARPGRRSPRDERRGAQGLGFVEREPAYRRYHR